MRAGFLLLCAAALAQGQTYEGLFAEAESLAARGEFGGAAAQYEAALRMRPGAVEALSNLSVVYYWAGRWADAEAAAAKALHARPELNAAKLIRGLALIRLNRSVEAVVPLREAAAKEPTNRDAVLGLGSAFVAVGNLEEAASVYERRTTMAPNDADAWYALAVCYERMAERASLGLSRLEDGSAWGKRFLGEYWLERGERRLAREAFTEALALDASQPGLLERLALTESNAPFQAADQPPQRPADRAGSLYEKARRLAEQARGAFERFTELAPSSWQAQLFLGDIHRQQRDFQAAIRYYREAGRLRPDSPWALGLGTVYWELADDENAAVYLHQALSVNPKSVAALFALGNLAVKQRRDDEAVRLLEQCLKLDPEHLGARADLGKALVRLGQDLRAVGHLEAARRIDTYGEINFQLGQALRRVGRVQDAEAAFNESKRIRQAQLEREQRLRIGQ